MEVRKTLLGDGDGEGDQAYVAVDLAPLAGQTPTGPGGDVAGKTAPPKLGIRNLSPHLRNSAILQTTKSIAGLRTKKSCGTAIADLQNLTSAIPQLSAVYFLVPFLRPRMVLKINQKYF
jgi:hypothetical protein